VPQVNAYKHSSGSQSTLYQHQRCAYGERTGITAQLSEWFSLFTWTLQMYVLMVRVRGTRAHAEAHCIERRVRLLDALCLLLSL
jgi:hypothetical protein